MKRILRRNKVHYLTSKTRKAYELGRKMRNKGNSLDANYFEKNDPCYAAWIDGWRDRNTELGYK